MHQFFNQFCAYPVSSGFGGIVFFCFFVCFSCYPCACVIRPPGKRVHFAPCLNASTSTLSLQPPFLCPFCGTFQAVTSTSGLLCSVCRADLQSAYRTHLIRGENIFGTQAAQKKKENRAHKQVGRNKRTRVEA